MSKILAQFANERAKQCHEAAKRAHTQELRNHWRKAEAQWLERCAALKLSEAMIKPSETEQGRALLPQVPLPTQTRLPLGITAERMKEWLDGLREGIQRRRQGKGPPEDPEIFRERARGCRQAAESARDPKVREYWLTAEAYWLSLIDYRGEP